MPTHATLFFSADPKIANTTSVQIPSTSTKAGSGADVKVLNFALALETLEAELYRQAVARLTTGGKDFYGKTITGLGLTGPDVDYLTKFARVEMEHQAFLEGALGGNWAVAAGAGFDFGFAAGNLLGTDPDVTRDRFGTVALVYAAEQTGISAYLGGAGPGGLTPGGPYLGIAASILGTEARHTTAVAILLNANPALYPAFKTKLATAPLAGDTGTAGGHGLDTALAPDAILHQGGMVAPDTTIAGDGKINPISGANGFVYVGT